MYQAHHQARPDVLPRGDGVRDGRRLIQLCVSAVYVIYIYILHVCIYIYNYVCVYIYICIVIYIYIYRHTHVYTHMCTKCHGL